MPTALRWVYNDGGRAVAGYKGNAGDCTCRAITIATGRPYKEVYLALNRITAATRKARPRLRGRLAYSSARSGVDRLIYDEYLLGELGWLWTPTMSIGSGTTVHLADGELPPGRLVVALSKHMTAVLDEVVHDTYDPGRAGTRAVYGYFREKD